MCGVEKACKQELPGWTQKRRYRRNSRMPTDAPLLVEKIPLQARHPNPYAGWKNERLIKEARSKAGTRIELVLADASLYLQLYFRDALDGAYPEEANGKKTGK